MKIRLCLGPGCRFLPCSNWSHVDPVQVSNDQAGCGYWVLGTEPGDRGREIIVIADINGASGHSNAHACTSHSTGHIML